MADPAQIDIIADRRVPLVEHFAFLDQDYTGSTFKMQVRSVRDSTGTPMLDDSGGNMTLVYAGTALVSAHITAGRIDNSIYELINPATGVHYVAGDSLLLSQIGTGIIASAIAGLPEPQAPAELGDDLIAWYDVIRIPSVGDNDVIMRGKFTVRAGVTIP